MFDTPDQLSNLALMQAPSENPVAQLSALWRQDQQPDRPAFLAGTERLSAAEMMDSLCTDQREWWTDGQRPAVEAYVERQDSLPPESALSIDLILDEFLAQRELGEFATLDEYCRRFPDLAEQLRLHVQLYDALEDVVPATDDTAIGPGVEPSTVFHAARASSRGKERLGAADRAAAAVALESGVQSANVTSQQRARLARAFRVSPAVFPELPGYEILGEAGRGGSGVVYKARQLSLQRLVAIKAVPLGVDREDQIFSRFHQERLLAALVKHPNLVAAYDAGEVAGLPYFVMEFVEGTGLDVLVNQRGPLPVAEVCEVIRQAALGLQHLHEHGLVHRDVKPSNLMLTPSGQVKVIDLGLARIASGSAQVGQISLPGQFLGTLDYMAPEQFDDCHTVDIRADIYSLGCTLYHLLAGDPPFAAFSSPYKKLKAHAETPAPPINAKRPDIPDRLAAALEQMLAKDRNGRYATPAEVGAALLPFAKDASLAELLRGDPRHRPMA